jgi:hypothetical protein
MSSASVLDPVKDITDRLVYLRNRTKTKTMTGIQVPLGLACVDQETLANPDAWQYRARYLVEHDKSNNNKAVIELGGLLLPDGVTITEVQALAHGDIFTTGTHAGLPGTMPTIRFREMNTSGGVNYTASQADTSGSVGAYEVDHPITVTVSRTIDHLMRYMIIIEGEQGANSLNDRFGLKSLSISWTAP